MTDTGESTTNSVPKPRLLQRASSAACTLAGRIRGHLRTYPAWLTSLAFHLFVLIGLLLVPYRPRAAVQRVVVETKLTDAPPVVEFARILEPEYDPGEEFDAGGIADLPTAGGVADGTNEEDPADPELPPEAPAIAKLSEVAPGRLPNEENLTLDVAIKGDPISVVGGIGEAVDQLTREILARLTKGPVLVIWMFDESRSMQDEQQDIKGRFHRVYQELANRPETRNDALLTAIVGFGKNLHFILERPTGDIATIREAIDRVPVDPSGEEWPCKHLIAVANRYKPYGTRGRRQIMLVLVTDESGQRSDDGLTPLDGAFLEDAIRAADEARMSVYVIGREAVFGYPFATVPFDANGRTYWLRVTRGPEAPDVECLQTIGIRPGRPFLLSGLGPWELVRLARETGGIYFLTPADEPGRRYSYQFDPLIMRNYLPDYGPRQQYYIERDRSRFRATIYEVIKRTARVGVPQVFPGAPQAFTASAARAVQTARQQRALLAVAYRQLQEVAGLYDEEASARWRAAFDLTAAELAAFQVRLYSYECMLLKLIEKPPASQKQPGPGQILRWEVRLCPSKVCDWLAADDPACRARADAEELLRQVVTLHPKTPWARLAEIHLQTGLSVRLVDVLISAPRPGGPPPPPTPSL